jgi:predicted RNase H-like HicB family nuclease
MSEYLVVIEHEGESWGAYCPDLPGVGVVGDSREDVEKLIREAIALHLEGLRRPASRSRNRPQSERHSSRCPPPDELRAGIGSHNAAYASSAAKSQHRATNDGAYRDRTGDLRLANPTDNPTPPDTDQQNRHD